MLYQSIHSVAGLLAMVLLITSCQHEPTPTIQAQSDSLITIKIPDFAAIVSTSRTPTGHLDQMLLINTVRYSPSSEVHTDSIRTKLLYDSLGRITGNLYLNNLPLAAHETEAQQYVKLAQYATIYQYRNNLPYRTFSQVSNYETPGSPFFQVNEFVYGNAPYPVFRLEYYADLTGKARLQRRFQLVYNDVGNLLEEIDLNKYLIHDRYRYQAGNIMYSESIDPKGPPINFHYEYVYDTKLNPVKGLFWYSGNNPPYINWSTNNIVRSTRVRSDSSIESRFVVSNQYDAHDRLVRQTTILTNGISDIGSLVWHYRYGQ